MYTGTTGHHLQRQTLNPVAQMIRQILSKHVLQGTVHFSTIPSLFGWYGEILFLSMLSSTHISWNSWASKSRPWSEWIFFGRSIPGNNFICKLHDQRHGLCFMVWNSKRLFPFRQIISDHKDVHVTGLSLWHWFNDVECNSFERITRAAAN